MYDKSNYPPGVTGREYEIQGADREWEAPSKGVCPHCDWDDQEYDVAWEEYQGNTHWFCPGCGAKVNADGESYE